MISIYKVLEKLESPVTDEERAEHRKLRNVDPRSMTADQLAVWLKFHELSEYMTAAEVNALVARNFSTIEYETAQAAEKATFDALVRNGLIDERI
jgi:hypothetical protein